MKWLRAGEPNPEESPDNSTANGIDNSANDLFSLGFRGLLHDFSKVYISQNQKDGEDETISIRETQCSEGSDTKITRENNHHNNDLALHLRKSNSNSSISSNRERNKPFAAEGHEAQHCNDSRLSNNLLEHFTTHIAPYSGMSLISTTSRFDMQSAAIHDSLIGVPSMPTSHRPLSSHISSLNESVLPVQRMGLGVGPEGEMANYDYSMNMKERVSGQKIIELELPENVIHSSTSSTTSSTSGDGSPLAHQSSSLFAFDIRSTHDRSMWSASSYTAGNYFGNGFSTTVPEQAQDERESDNHQPIFASRSDFCSDDTSPSSMNVMGPRERAVKESTAGQRDYESEQLVNWIESVINRHGGSIIGANLGSALASSNALFYKAIKNRFGGLTPLLASFPERFLLANDPPFNHITVRSSLRMQPASPYVSHQTNDSQGTVPLVTTDSPAPQTNLSQISVRNNGLLVRPQGARKSLPNAMGSTATTASFMLQPNRFSMSGKTSIEQQVLRCACQILQESPTKMLKAVELANTLRARLGTDALAAVREQHGGLLTLLERFPNHINVRRIPKSDCVSLVYPGNGDSGSLADTNCSGMSSSTADSNSVMNRSLLDTPQIGDSITYPSSGIGLSPMLFGDSCSNTTPSRCLHVGNVGPHVTEEALTAEFSQYGSIETLKLVSQKGRRFAFVNFTSVEEAECAKNILSRHSQWKSNISYAKRETISIAPQRPCPPTLHHSSGFFGGVNGLFGGQKSTPQERPQTSVFISNNNQLNPDLSYPCPRMRSTSPLQPPNQHWNRQHPSSPNMIPELGFQHHQKENHHQRYFNGFAQANMPSPPPQPHSAGLSFSNSVANTPAQHRQLLYMTPPLPPAQMLPGPSSGAPSNVLGRTSTAVTAVNNSHMVSGSVHERGQCFSNGRLPPPQHQPFGAVQDFRVQENMLRPPHGSFHQNQHIGDPSYSEISQPQIREPNAADGLPEQSSTRALSAGFNMLDGRSESYHGQNDLPIGLIHGPAAPSNPLLSFPQHIMDQSCPVSQDLDKDVLSILTSDKFIPSQMWPATISKDGGYVIMLRRLLAICGGSASISSLRSLMRHRLQCAKTIKSVPLKALLLAYSDCFCLRGNQVILLQSNKSLPIQSCVS